MHKPINPNDFYRLLDIPNQSDLLLIGSILEREGIIHHMQNQELQSLFGMGTIGTGYQAAIGPVRLLVAGRDLERTETILKEAGLWPQSPAVPADSKTSTRTINPVTRSILFSLFWFFGLGSLIGIYFGLVARRHKQRWALVGILLGIIGMSIAPVLLLNALQPGSRWS